MDDNNNSKSSFLAHFLTFVSQGITGVLFPFYKEITDNGTFQNKSKKECIDQFHDFNIVPLLYIDYINECWDKYNKRDKLKENNENDENDEDEYNYIIVKLDKIKKSGNIIHNYCLFDLLWNFSFKTLIIVLARIDESIIRDFDTFKISINNMIDITLEINKQELFEYEENCNNFDYNKIINIEDKFIHVKYVMNIC